MNLKQHFPNAWVVCPNTGRQDTGEQVTVHRTSSGLAVWWRCSTCHNWHMRDIPAKQKKSSQLKPRQDSPKNDISNSLMRREYCANY